MSTFSLRIGTPDGLLFEGDVERVVCRSIGGDIAILARHCNFCTAHGRWKQTNCGLYWRDAFCYERHLSSSRDHLGVEGRY